MTTTTFEDLLSKAGDLGRWQLLLYAFIGLNGFFMGFQHLGSVFLAATPDHWCRVPGLREGWIDDPQLKALALPREYRQDEHTYSQCSYYDRDYASLLLLDSSQTVNVSTTATTLYNNGTMDEFSFVNRTNNNATLTTIGNSYNVSESARVASCNEWDYDRTIFTSTLVTEWHLVCDLKALKASVQALYMGGVFLGCLLYGCISDRFGRKKAVVIAQAHFCTAAILASFSPAFPVLLLCRFLIGIAAPGIFACPFVLVTELVGLKWRGILGICYQIPFGLGYAALPGLAYFIREWNWLQLAMSVPACILLTSFWVLPESPRWLITKGRFEEALVILKSCARFNRRQFPPDHEVIGMMKQMKHETSSTKQASKSAVLKKLFQSRELRKRTLVGFFTWIIVALVYYGLALESPSIGGNIYLMVFLGGILEIPAYLLGFIMVHVFGRRLLYSATFLLAATTAFAIIAVPSSITWLKPTLAIGGKFFITITFAISYLYTAELFPTVVRNIAVNIGSMGGRMGSITAPYIVYELRDYHPAIPLAVCGTLSLIAGLLALLLPETKSANLSESITDLNSPDQPQRVKESTPPSRPAVANGKYEMVPLGPPKE